MNLDRGGRILVLKALIPCCALALGIAHAGDAPDTVAGHLGTVAKPTIGHPNNAKKPLDLRTPELQRVMSHRMLAELGTNPEEEELVEIVAAPPLMPMTSDANAPLGIIGSLQWSADHPTQAWRILLPLAGTP